MSSPNPHHKFLMWFYIFFVTSYLPHVKEVRTVKLGVYDLRQQFRYSSNISDRCLGVAGFESPSGERLSSLRILMVFVILCMQVTEE